MSAAAVTLDGRALELRVGESVLEACRRTGVPLRFSCGAGYCHTCRLQCVAGEIPSGAQRGLPPAQQEAGDVLACLCRPTSTLHLATVGERPDAPADELREPSPDARLWKELGQERVRAVLEDFYRQIYAEPRLAPFFDGVTIDRSIDKQYSFMRQLMTGDRVYFGDRPRNAHHWMVISGDLFDYRQALMRTTLRRHGLTPSQVRRWTRLEEHYRADIVKAAPWPRRVAGMDLPVEGYAREVLLEATVCDHCGEPIAAGEEVSYHVRLGHVSCARCAPATTPA